MTRILRTLFTPTYWCFCAASCLGAVQNYWTGAAGDNLWTNAANWTLGVPNSTQDVFIQQTTDQVVLNAPAQTAAFTLGSTQGIASLTISAGGNLDYSGKGQILSASVLNLVGGTITGLHQKGFTVDGTLNLSGGVLSTIVTNNPSGNVVISGLAGSPLLIGKLVNRGTLTGYGTNLIAHSSSSLFNSGTIVITSGNNPLPTTFYLSGVFENSGTIRVETNAVLEMKSIMANTIQLRTGTVFEGEGLIRLASDFYPTFSGNIILNTTLDFQAGNPAPILSQPGPPAAWSGTGLFLWNAGWIDSFTFKPDLNVTVTGNGDGLGMRGACTNQGALHWRDGRHWLILVNGTLRNEGEFIIETNCEIYPYAISNTFENTGVIKTLPNGGTVLLRTAGPTCFTNRGTLRAETNSTLELGYWGYYSALDGIIFETGTIFEGPGVVKITSDTSRAFFLGTQIVNGVMEYSGGGAGGGRSIWTGPGLLRCVNGTLRDFTFAPDFHVEAVPKSGNGFLGTSTNLGSIRYAGLNLYIDAAFYNYGQLVVETNCVLERYNATTTPTFYNWGTLRVPAQSGSIWFILYQTSLSNRGIVLVESNAVWQVDGTSANGVGFGDGTVFDGAGITRFVTYSTDWPIDFSGLLTVNGTVGLAGVTAVGKSTWTGAGVLQWHTGSFGNFTLSPGFQAQLLPGDTKTLWGACTNLGTLRWMEGGTLASGCGASIYNGGAIQIETNGVWDNSIILNNLPGGTFLQRAGQFSMGTLKNDGLVQLDTGFLTVSNSFISGPAATCQVTLGGYAPGISFGVLSTPNLVNAGSLTVLLTNGFSPSAGNSFRIAMSSNEVGQFSSLTLPGLQSNLTWQVSYASNAVSLNVAPAAPLTLKPAGFSLEGDFVLTLAGSAAAGFEVQASTDLVHWVQLETNGPFTGEISFTDTNAPLFLRRFYRARIFD